MINRLFRVVRLLLPFGDERDYTFQVAGLVVHLVPDAGEGHSAVGPVSLQGARA